MTPGTFGITECISIHHHSMQLYFAVLLQLFVGEWPDHPSLVQIIINVPGNPYITPPAIYETLLFGLTTN